ncbi:MAG: DUF456 domain-containing protein [Actinomycetes bacterium]
MDDTALTILVGIAMLVGLAGVLVPVLPGTSLILVAGLGWALFVADGGAVRWVVAGALVVLFVVGAVLKYALPGRHMKGQLPRRTLVYGGVGAVVGFVVLPPLGLLLGGAVGVYVGEVQRLGAGSEARQSTVRVLKSVGLGVLAELVAAALMVGTWLVGVLVS